MLLLLLEVRPQELPALSKPLENVTMLENAPARPFEKGAPALILAEIIPAEREAGPLENHARIRCQRH